jgi:translation initiation factor IF-2
MTSKTLQKKLIPRPPIVSVVGHIDHGKSTLLDYIRKTKITEGEAGGITQRLSAYEAEHILSSGEKRIITFLDTPGHEAFQHLRSRGNNAADVAILVVAADDGVKPQTKEALKAIYEANIPFIVALTKIDKENADIEKAKRSLLENGVYLEGLGGDISFVPISSKTGEGIQQLLDLVLLTIDIDPIEGDPSLPATGVVIESHCDPKRGITAVLLIQNGTMEKGHFVVAGHTCAPLRIIENFMGKPVESATFSSPITVVGFSDIPPVGEPFLTVKDKKTAGICMSAGKENENFSLEEKEEDSLLPEDFFIVPLIVKADVVGSLEAIKHELKKYTDERTRVHIVHQGIGDINENDIKLARSDKKTIVIGFGVGIDASAQELSQRLSIEIIQCDIIYRLEEWMPQAIEKRRPKIKREKVIGNGLVIKVFNTTTRTHTLGVRMQEGVLKINDTVRIFRKEELCGTGKIERIKTGPKDVKEAKEGQDYGILLEGSFEDIRYGDILLYSVIEEI